MKTVKRFETNDGKLFKEETAAQNHESMVDAVEDATRSILPKKLDDCEFANGSGYIQLTAIQREDFFKQYEACIKEYHKSWLDIYKKQPTGIIGRYLCDNNSPIYRLYCLAVQIDSKNRFWGQPYYATHPTEGKQVQLNR